MYLHVAKFHSSFQSLLLIGQTGKNWSHDRGRVGMCTHTYHVRTYVRTGKPPRIILSIIDYVLTQKDATDPKLCNVIFHK